MSFVLALGRNFLQFILINIRRRLTCERHTFLLLLLTFLIIIYASTNLRTKH
jgi:hypothetical protein